MTLFFFRKTRAYLNIGDILKGNESLLRCFCMLISGKTVKKCDLPEKECRVCGRPFSWRKKWIDCWEEVVYCSNRCRSNKKR